MFACRAWTRLRVGLDAAGSRWGISLERYLLRHIERTKPNAAIHLLRVVLDYGRGRDPIAAANDCDRY